MVTPPLTSPSPVTGHDVRNGKQSRLLQRWLIYEALQHGIIMGCDSRNRKSLVAVNRRQRFPGTPGSVIRRTFRASSSCSGAISPSSSTTPRTDLPSPAAFLATTVAWS